MLDHWSHDVDLAEAMQIAELVGFDLAEWVGEKRSAYMW